jgi:arginase family enzyme
MVPELPFLKDLINMGDCHYQQIIKSRKVICFEVVEVNPLLDTKGNKMETAFEVLEQITSTVILPLE